MLKYNELVSFPEVYMTHLTKKETAFSQEYIIDLNATAACKRAGYSEKSADKIAHQLLGKTRVQEEIQRLQKERSIRTQITADKVLQELAAVAFARVPEIMAAIEEGKEDFPAYAALKTVKNTQSKNGESTLNISIDGKVKALELLGKHLGMFDKKDKKSPLDRERSLDRIRGAIRRVKESHAKINQPSQPTQ